MVGDYLKHECSPPQVSSASRWLVISLENKLAPVTKPEPITQGYIYSQPLLIIILDNNDYALNRNLVPRYYFSLSNQRLARGTIVQVVENPVSYVMMKADKTSYDILFHEKELEQLQLETVSLLPK